MFSSLFNLYYIFLSVFYDNLRMYKRISSFYAVGSSSLSYIAMWAFYMSFKRQASHKASYTFRITKFPYSKSVKLVNNEIKF